MPLNDERPHVPMKCLFGCYQMKATNVAYMFGLALHMK